MAFIKKIRRDGKSYDIAAKNLVNGFTQTTPGVNALDAAAGKSLNDSFVNTLANWNTVSVYSGTANIVAAYTDYATASCTLDPGTYIVQAEVIVNSAVSNIGYYVTLKDANNFYVKYTTQKAGGYSVSCTATSPIVVTAQNTLTLTCSVNYLGGQSSAGTASGKLRVLKLK